MATHITVIQGHPDRKGKHFVHAAVEAYVAGALQAGHEVRLIHVAELDTLFLQSADSFYHEILPPGFLNAQEAILWADHLVIAYPLWLGQFPALLHAFFEQIMRPGFAIDIGEGRQGKKLLIGKSARLIVTMAMPAWIFRWIYGALSARALKVHILNFSGIAPVRMTFIGWLGSGTTDPNVARFLPVGLDEAGRKRWLSKLAGLGRRAV